MTRRIAVSQRVVENSTYPETRDVLARDWPDWIGTVLPQAAILPVPNRAAGIDDWWGAAAPDALVLSGGNDWGQAPDRDETERRLLEAAQGSGVPVLAVCRGLHVVNVCFGGTVAVDLASIAPGQHVSHDHAIDLDDSPVASLSGGQTATVNSYHNQGILKSGVAKGFKVFALADGDIVEGMFHETKPILAIQWHPERPSPSAAFDRALTQAVMARGAFWTAAP